MMKTTIYQYADMPETLRGALRRVASMRPDDDAPLRLAPRPATKADADRARDAQRCIWISADGQMRAMDGFILHTERVAASLVADLDPCADGSLYHVLHAGLVSAYPGLRYPSITAWIDQWAAGLARAVFTDEDMARYALVSASGSASGSASEEDGPVSDMLILQARDGERLTVRVLRQDATTGHVTAHAWGRRIPYDTMGGVGVAGWSVAVAASAVGRALRLHLDGRAHSDLTLSEVIFAIPMDGGKKGWYGQGCLRVSSPDRETYVMPCALIKDIPRHGDDDEDVTP